MPTVEAALAFASHGDWTRVVPAARQALASDPQDAMAHALLALGLAHLRQRREAVDAGRRAVSLNPELAFAHYAHGWALLEYDEPDKAEEAAREALRLDPGAHAYALLAQIRVRQRHWQGALVAAESGLQHDPEDGACSNLRAVALAHLGRTDAASAVVQDVLELDPDDAYAHANHGWVLLRQSRPDEALNSFREALRLDPTLEWARLGIVEAMKARKGAYRLILRYSLWVDTLSPRARWFLIIGIFLGARLVRTVARENPPLLPVLGPLLAVYSLLVLGTWVVHPISNLLLRMDPIGRLALSQVETVASNIVGGCLATAVFAGVMFLISGGSSWLTLAIVSSLMLIPIGGAIQGHATKAWLPLLIALVVLAVGGTAAVVLAFVDGSAGGVALGLFLVAAFLYGWVANYLVIKYA